MFRLQTIWATDVCTTDYLGDRHLGDMGRMFGQHASRRLGDTPSGRQTYGPHMLTLGMAHFVPTSIAQAALCMGWHFGFNIPTNHDDYIMVKNTV